MEFIESPDNKDFQMTRCARVTLKNGRIFEIGVYRVVYGYRVRGCYIPSYGPTLDWCCGDDEILITLTIEVMRRLILDGVPIDKIPRMSEAKPWTTDFYFVRKLQELHIYRAT